MSDVISTNMNSDEFKNKVAEDLKSIRVGTTSSVVLNNPTEEYPNVASRPVNVDEDGNIINISKSNEPEAAPEEAVVSDNKYDRGLEDAFNALKKIVRKNHVDGYDEEELNTIFGESDPIEIFSDFSIQTILRNIYDYEALTLQKKIFNKGDEVLVSEEGYAEDEYDRLVVLYTDGDYIVGFNSQGKTRKVNKLNCKLTGKTFASLVDIFNEMDNADA